jgi:hypothetical protein
MVFDPLFFNPQISQAQILFRYLHQTAMAKLNQILKATRCLIHGRSITYHPQLKGLVNPNSRWFYRIWKISGWADGGDILILNADPGKTIYKTDIKTVDVLAGPGLTSSMNKHWLESKWMGFGSHGHFRNWLPAQGNAVVSIDGRAVCETIKTSFSYRSS